jgi:hypothetical protein
MRHVPLGSTARTHMYCAFIEVMLHCLSCADAYLRIGVYVCGGFVSQSTVAECIEADAGPQACSLAGLLPHKAV